MPGGKKGKGSPKKATDLTITKSKAKQQRQQQQQIDSLVSLSSPVKSRTPKKLLTVQEERKSLLIHDHTSTQQEAAVNLPEQEQEPIAQVVTATKQSKESSDTEEHSTENDSSGFQVKTSTRFRTSKILNLPSMAGPRLDAKIEHLLEPYFLAKGAGHGVRKMFKENDF